MENEGKFCLRKILVPRAGLEPARRYSQPRILSPVRLPISPPGPIMR